MCATVGRALNKYAMLAKRVYNIVLSFNPRQLFAVYDSMGSAVNFRVLVEKKQLKFASSTGDHTLPRSMRQCATAIEELALIAGAVDKAPTGVGQSVGAQPQGGVDGAGQRGQEAQEEG